MSSLAALHVGIAISDFGWVRCRVYIGPLHPTNFFNSKSPEGVGTDYPSSCPSAGLLLLPDERKGKFDIHHYLAPDLTDCCINPAALLDARGCGAAASENLGDAVNAIDIFLLRG